MVATDDGYDEAVGLHRVSRAAIDGEVNVEGVPARLGRHLAELVLAAPRGHELRPVAVVLGADPLGALDLRVHRRSIAERGVLGCAVAHHNLPVMVGSTIQPGILRDVVEVAHHTHPFVVEHDVVGIWVVIASAEVGHHVPAVLGCQVVAELVRQVRYHTFGISVFVLCPGQHELLVACALVLVGNLVVDVGSDTHQDMGVLQPVGAVEHEVFHHLRVVVDVVVSIAAVIAEAHGLSPQLDLLLLLGGGRCQVVGLVAVLARDVAVGVLHGPDVGLVHVIVVACHINGNGAIGIGRVVEIAEIEATVKEDDVIGLVDVVLDPGAFRLAVELGYLHDLAILQGVVTFADGTLGIGLADPHTDQLVSHRIADGIVIVVAAGGQSYQCTAKGQDGGDHPNKTLFHCYFVFYKMNNYCLFCFATVSIPSPSEQGGTVDAILHSLVDERLIAAYLMDDDVVLQLDVLVLAMHQPKQNDNDCRQHRYNADEHKDDCGCLHNLCAFS